MAEIKKKSTMGHSTRMIDRTADAGTRIKNVALKTRDAAQKNEGKEDSSPSAYASERITNVSKMQAIPVHSDITRWDRVIFMGMVCMCRNKLLAKFFQKIGKKLDCFFLCSCDIIVL